MTVMGKTFAIGIIVLCGISGTSSSALAQKAAQGADVKAEKWGFDKDTLVEDTQNLSLYTYGPNTTCNSNQNNFAGGSGTLADPYLVANETQFRYMLASCQMSKEYFKLTNHIDYRLVSLASTLQFWGHLDGNLKTISHFSLTASGGRASMIISLFGSVRNVVLDDFHVEGIDAAPLANHCTGCVIENVRVQNSTVAATIYAGGLVAEMAHGLPENNLSREAQINMVTIAQSVIVSSGGHPSAPAYAGGVAGRAGAGGVGGSIRIPHISSAVSFATLSSENYAGGIAAYSQARISYSKSSIGLIFGRMIAGGIVAHNALFGDIDMTRSNAPVAVSRPPSNSGRSVSYAGGLVGWNQQEVSRSYTANSVSTLDHLSPVYMGGLIGIQTGAYDFDTEEYTVPKVTDSFSLSRVYGSSNAQSVTGGFIGIHHGIANRTYVFTTILQGANRRGFAGEITPSGSIPGEITGVTQNSAWNYQSSGLPISNDTSSAWAISNSVMNQYPFWLALDFDFGRTWTLGAYPYLTSNY